MKIYRFGIVSSCLILTPSLWAAGFSKQSSAMSYFFQVGSGFSQSQSIPEFQLQGGLNLSQAQLRWAYRLGFGALAKEINNNRYSFELGFSQYTKNRWLFAPLNSSVKQDLKGIEILTGIHHRINSKALVAIKGGGVLLRQNISATATFNDPTRFTFEHLGTTTKIRPIAALELIHTLTDNASVYMAYSYIFGQSQTNAATLGGAAPSPVLNGSWQAAPSIQNLMCGLTYTW